MKNSPIPKSLFIAGCSLLAFTSCKSSDTEDKASAQKVSAQKKTSKTKQDADSTSGQATQAPTDVDAKSSEASAPQYSCGSDGIWTEKEYKQLQDGKLETIQAGVELPSVQWEPCEGQDHCQKIKLSAEQKLLAVGQNGNKASLLVADTCEDNTVALWTSAEGPAHHAIRGVDMAFESASIGGDRLLLGGYARHRSAAAEDGYVSREYLVTARQGQFEKLEPARNKLQAVPGPVSSQLVTVKIGGKNCSTMFWKLGVGECDFEGPPNDNFAIFGSNLVFEDGGKGTKWTPKYKSQELLPVMEWIISDGVNVAWSADERLYLTQPRWDLPELKAEPAKGPAGPRPIALGCGRLLVKSDEGWILRNIAQGTQWMLNDGRFPSELGESVAMTCEEVLFQSGYRVSLKSPGTALKVEDIADPAHKDAPQQDSPAPQPSTTALDTPDEADTNAPAE